MPRDISFLRRQFSSMSILDELHKQAKDKSGYTCNNCKRYVKTVYHCTACNDFNLCVNCAERDDHPHLMEKREITELSLRRYIYGLTHACQCREPNCPLSTCLKIKRALVHTEHCQKKINGTCLICKQLIALCCYHAKHCKETGCLVPSCSIIKGRIRIEVLKKVLDYLRMRRLIH